MVKQCLTLGTAYLYYIKGVGLVSLSMGDVSVNSRSGQKLQYILKVKDALS